MPRYLPPWAMPTGTARCVPAVDKDDATVQGIETNLKEVANVKRKELVTVENKSPGKCPKVYVTPEDGHAAAPVAKLNAKLFKPPTTDLKNLRASLKDEYASEWEQPYSNAELGIAIKDEDELCKTIVRVDKHYRDKGSGSSMSSMPGHHSRLAPTWHKITGADVTALIEPTSSGINGLARAGDAASGIGLADALIKFAIQGWVHHSIESAVKEANIHAAARVCFVLGCMVDPPKQDVINLVDPLTGQPLGSAKCSMCDVAGIDTTHFDSNVKSAVEIGYSSGCEVVTMMDKKAWSKVQDGFWDFSNKFDRAMEAAASGKNADETLAQMKESAEALQTSVKKASPLVKDNSNTGDSPRFLRTSTRQSPELRS